MMLNLGIDLIVFGFVGSILTNIIMLMKFLSRAKQGGPAIGELVHTLFMGVLGKSYRTLLLNDGLSQLLSMSYFTPSV